MSMNLELINEMDNIYSSEAHGSYNKRSIFGGIIISQSLIAAYKTVDPTMNLHSLQVYFISRGDPKQSLKYLIDPMMNGRSFVKRSVTVMQKETLISKVHLSFKIEEPLNQFIYIPKFPQVKRYDKCPFLLDLVSQKLKDQLKEVTLNRLTEYSAWISDFPIDVKPVDPDVQSFIQKNASNKIFTWLKLRDIKLLDVDSRYAKHALLGFISDLMILQPIVTMHCDENIGIILSLDHVMWFQCSKFNIKDWLLIEVECNVANNGTTLNSGRIWSENGVLLATIMQEGIIRPPIAKT